MDFKEQKYKNTKKSNNPTKQQKNRKILLYRAKGR